MSGPRLPNLHRKASVGPKVRWNIKVPAELAAVLENHFWSSTLGKPIYGKRNALIVKLLTDYVEANQLDRAVVTILPPTEVA